MTTRKMIKKKIDELRSFKQKAFVIEIKKQWKNGNVSPGLAAIKAGYKTKAHGSALMKNDDIRAAISEEIARTQEKCGITNEMIICELKKMAFSNIKNVAEWDESGVRFKNSSDTPDWVTAGIQEISESRTGRTVEKKLKMYDKQKALAELAKIFQLYDGAVGEEDEEEGIDALVNGLDSLRKEIGVKRDVKEERDEYEDMEFEDENDLEEDENIEDTVEYPKLSCMDKEDLEDMGFSTAQSDIIVKLKDSGLLDKLKDFI